MMLSAVDRKTLKATHLKITKKFQPLSLFLRRDATELIGRALRENDIAEENIDRALDAIASAVAEQQLTSQFVEKEVVQEVIAKLLSGGVRSRDTEAVSDETVLQVIDAFDTPRLRYSMDTKQFLSSRDKLSLHPTTPASRAQIFRERFHVLRQRTLRHHLFSRKLEGSLDEVGSFKLTPISALLGHSRYRVQGGNGLVVMGMLAQLEEGRYYLEDLDGKVQLSLVDVECGNGLFTENTVVIAEGRYEDGIFHAQTIALPPSEPREASIKSIGALNYFGGTSNSVDQAALSRVEIGEESAMFVVVSDVWLDKPQVIDKLRQMFEGYSVMEPPPVFVLMGNFLSEPHGPKTAKVLKEGFDTLADIISEYPGLAQASNFIFVPGPKDPGAPTILPRRALPARCTARLQQKVRKATFTTNPARVRYCTQELVFFREDIVNKMRRNCLLSPKVGDGEPEITAHLVKSLLDQATLMPLPPHVSPVYWEYDHALSLYPTPDVLVLADKFDSYRHTYEGTGTTALNPGPFMASDFSFMVYWPAKLRIDPTESIEAREEFEERAEFSRIV